jgi:predicted FMN-binding regulatory protein PaiB
MFESPNYPTDPAAVDAFVASQRHGTLIAQTPGGYPQITIIPFVKHGDEIEIHCVQGDPTLDAVRANPRVTFLVSDFLAFSPHDWISDEDAGRATLHFRAVAFECDATVSTDPADVAAALERLVSAYHPDTPHHPVADDEFYGPRLRRLATMRLAIVNTRAKFKTGPAGTAQLKRDIAERLRERGEPNDARAADVILSYVD